MKKLLLLLLTTTFIIMGCGESSKPSAFEENRDYEIIKINKSATLNNIYALVLADSCNEQRLDSLAKHIAQEKSPNIQCNVHIYDSKEIQHLMEKYPIEGQEYVDVADHFVYMLSFDGMGWYYPLKDALYIEYGGKHPKQ